MSTTFAFAAMNAGYLAGGCGTLWLLGVAGRGARRVDFLLLAYAAGVAACGVVVALLAVVDAVPSRVGFAALVAALLVSGAGVRRRRESRPVAVRAPWTLFDTAAAVVVGVCFVMIVSRFYRWPLDQWDGWAIWSLKTHALYLWGGVSSPALHAPAYNHGSHLDYPLLVPGLEAVWLRVLGHYSGELMHLQLVCFLAAFAAGLFVLLRQFVSPPLRLLIIVAATSTPAIVDQLVTNYADIPLACFVALGVSCLARWSLVDDPVLLRLASLFLAAAVLTKNEGTVFVAAGYLATTVSRGTRGRRRPLALAALATALPLVVWRAYTTTHGLTDPAYDPSLLRHPIALGRRVSRVRVAFDALAAQGKGWDFLLAVPFVAVVAAFFARRYRALVFAVSWVVLSLAGLLVAFWISTLPIHEHVRTSADRIVASLVVGLLALAGVIGSERPAPARRAD
jgi:hypothetical protein